MDFGRKYEFSISNHNVLNSKVQKIQSLPPLTKCFVLREQALNERSCGKTERKREQGRAKSVIR